MTHARGSSSEGEDELRENLLLALDMFGSGIELQRASLHSRYPELTDEEIEEKLVSWLHNRPLDGTGTIVPWPRNGRATPS